MMQSLWPGLYCSLRSIVRLFTYRSYDEFADPIKLVSPVPGHAASSLLALDLWEEGEEEEAGDHEYE